MKKIIFGLLLLVASTLLLVKYLNSMGVNRADDLFNTLVATDSKPDLPKVAENKPSVTEQVTNAVVKQVTDNLLTTANQQAAENTPHVENHAKDKAKTPIAVVKIYDKKNAKDITIETPSTLAAQQQTLTPQQQAEQIQKQAKFRAYYQKPEKCLSPIDKETRVACGNDYMRAKAKFEELYQQGKL